MSNIVTVNFGNDTLFAVERDDGVYVAVTPICDALGLAPQMQRKRIQNDAILREGGITTILPSIGGIQETFCHCRIEDLHPHIWCVCYRMPENCGQHSDIWEKNR